MVPPRGALTGASHLRSMRAKHPHSSRAASPSEGAPNDPIPDDSNASASAASINSVPRAAAPFHKTCTLWLHDDNFSKEALLLNQNAFGDGHINAGDLVEILPVRTTSEARDFRHLPESTIKFASGIGEGDGSLRNTIYSHSSREKNNVSTGTGDRDHSASYDQMPNLEGQPRCIALVKPLPPEIKARQPALQLSLTASVASVFGFKNRSQVVVSVIDRESCSASHVELVFRDEYLHRSDMWRLVMSELVERPVHRGQKILFVGSIKATIKNIYVRGRKVQSAYFSSSTIPVFRSESARFVLFIQMSKEMWDFDSEGSGEILFNRVINGFLPDLFKRWADLEARHLVSIVMFTRIKYDQPVPITSGPYGSGLGSSKTSNDKLFKDFFRVVVTDMASGQWTTILNNLKREFRTFLRDVSIRKSQDDLPEELEGSREDLEAGTRAAVEIAGKPTTAFHGNILEAIDMATTQFAGDHIDRDLVRTGVSVIIITPGAGVFEVPYDKLALTTENLTNNALGIDLVCLSQLPLHSVPLFRYRRPGGSLKGTGSTLDRGSISRSSPSDFHGSFGNRTIGRSSNASTYFGSLPKSMYKSQMLASKDEWCYGIPHWIDVSFWSPDNAKRHQKVEKARAMNSYRSSKNSKTFVPRVRMYEIQMMGVMESEQSNIFVPYLTESAIRSRHANSLAASSINSGEGESHLSRLLSPAVTPRPSLTESRIDAHLASRSLRTSTSIMTGRRTQDIYSFMDQYDSQVFHPFPRRPKTKRHSKKKHHRESSTKLAGQKGKDTPKQRASMESSVSALPRSDALPIVAKAGPNAKASKAAMTSLVPALGQPLKPATAAKAPPSRLSRSISYALRGLGGLGVAVPRAAASTKVNVENARADIATNSAAASIASGSESKPSSVSDAETTRSDSQSHSSADTGLGSLSKLTIDLDNGEPTASRPIQIKAASRRSQEDDSVNNSYSTTVTRINMETGKMGALQAASITKQQGPKLDISFGSPSYQELPKNLSPTSALHPWIKNVNPSNPKKTHLDSQNWFGRWQHIYPSTPRAVNIKWKSLMSPASLPVTTEEFPTKEQLAVDYLQTPYRVYQNDDHDVSEAPKSRENFLRELICLRLNRGYQIVVGPLVAAAFGIPALEDLNVFDTSKMAQDGSTIIMSLANNIHRLVCISDSEIEVTRFARKVVNEEFKTSRDQLVYNPVIRTPLSRDYLPRSINLEKLTDEYKWNYADMFVAGHRDHLFNPTQQLRFWRARFVLIPVPLSPNARRPMQSLNEDNEEEIRLLGIKQLTQMWQRYRYVPPEERRFQSSTRKKKDHNPLDIMYMTQNPSEVVAAELDRVLLSDAGHEDIPSQLLPESEQFQRDNLSLQKLARAIQSERGVRMMDRRWHWRLHYNCFIGVEFTTWMLENFRDIDTREEAVEFGNQLMEHGLFQHVERRHNFRDGNYFYQLSVDHRAPRPESRSSWFPARRPGPDKSVPSTPMTESTFIMESPLANRSRPPSSHGNDSNGSGAPTPTKVNRARPTVCLSKMMKYDLDPRKRSDRSEIIDVHYDRLHNPDNCFHLELAWLNVTPKLIEDTIVSWASTSEKFGLKLVEVPIGEAHSISDREPFRQPYKVELKLKPPRGRTPAVYTTATFSPQSAPTDQFFFQKAILKRFDFVLDFEAKTDFPADVEVTYTWGNPDYKYPQFIHRSGILLVQVTEDGNFLFIANRLYNTRSIASKDASKYDRYDNYHYRSGNHTRPGTSAGPAHHGNTVGTSQAADFTFSSPHPSPLVRATADVLPVQSQLGLPPSTSSSNISGSAFQGYQLPTSTSSSLLASAASHHGVQLPSSSHSNASGSNSASIALTPGSIKNQVENFCHDVAALERFYSEVRAKGLISQSGSIGPVIGNKGVALSLAASLAMTASTNHHAHGITTSPRASPRQVHGHGSPQQTYAGTRISSGGVSLDSSIPSLELPVSVLAGAMGARRKSKDIERIIKEDN